MESVSCGIDILPFQMVKTQEFKGEVSMAVTPSDFYLNNVEDDVFEAYTLMLKDLKNSYDSKNGDPYKVKPSDLNIGRYVAFYHFEIWMRGCIFEFKPDGTWKVFALDIGDLISCDIKDIRKLKKKFLELPIQAIPAKLAFLHPNEPKWKPEAGDMFRDIFMDKDIIVTVISTKPDETDGRYAVCLLHPTTRRSLDIELHQAGLAVFPGQKMRLDKENLLRQRVTPLPAPSAASPGVTVDMTQADAKRHHPLLPPPGEAETSVVMEPVVTAIDTDTSSLATVVEVTPHDVWVGGGEKEEVKPIITTPTKKEEVNEMIQLFQRINVLEQERKNQQKATFVTPVSTITTSLPPPPPPSSRPLEPPGFPAAGTMSSTPPLSAANFTFSLPYPPTRMPPSTTTVVQQHYPPSPLTTNNFYQPLMPCLPSPQYGPLQLQPLQNSYYQYTTQQSFSLPPQPPVGPPPPPGPGLPMGFFNQQMNHNFWSTK